MGAVNLGFRYAVVAQRIEPLYDEEEVVSSNLTNRMLVDRPPFVSGGPFILLLNLTFGSEFSIRLLPLRWSVERQKPHCQ